MKEPIHLFDAVGVELEYMIVDRETLNIRPIADQLIHGIAGTYCNEVVRGAISWSNELVLHVIELKTNGPACSLEDLHLKFQQQVNDINRLLAQYNAMLLPTAMHPWMDPYREMKLWPHEYNPIYEAYNRIFDCRGHGWANLQSTHINLPFNGDEEFEKLHAAIRILLPILPALAASSPIADGRKTVFGDYRMEVYRTNSIKIPSITGYIVPEPVFTRKDYERKIFNRMYRDIAPRDPDGILQDEWLNSRGAIARFDRGSIEIRVLDIQESPLADLAIVRLIIDTLKALVDEKFCSRREQESWNEKALYKILLYVIREADKSELPNVYSSLFGKRKRNKLTANMLWKHIFYSLYSPEQVESDLLVKTAKLILERGTLSGRILEALPDPFSLEELRILYQSLAGILSEGKLFAIHE